MKTAAQKILKKIFISFFLLLACRCCFAGSAGDPTSFGDWSDSIRGSTFRARLKARLVISETTDASGSSIANTYVEFQNTNRTVNTLYVYWGGTNSTLDCELRDSSGKA